MSAAFDTIDHQVLLHALHRDLGVTGTALEWFESYLAGRHQSVRIVGTLSEKMDVPYGVTQCSVLGPQLFSIFTAPLAKVISDMNFHLYADDNNLYLTFNPESALSIDTSLTKIHRCTSSIGKWMHPNFLKMKSDKTVVLFITQPSLSIKSISSVQICD